MGRTCHFSWMRDMKIVADKDIPHLDLFSAANIELTLLPGRTISHHDVKDADGLLVRSITRVDSALLHNTSIKWVGSLTAGVDHLDTDWLASHHIAHRACPGFNAPPVADYVMSTLAALMMKGHLRANHLHAAVIGVGHVGSLIVERLHALQFQVTMVDPVRAKEEAYFPHTALHTIQDVDLICVHTPLTKTDDYPTYHMIDADFMAKQKPGCVLLNAARGGVIDTNALLSHGKHLITCLDVFENEPVIDLAVLEATAISTPHIAGHTIESKRRGVLSLYQWIMEQAAVSVATPPFKHHSLTIPTTCRTWYSVVQQAFDLMQLSGEFKEALLSENMISSEFDRIRKQYGNRHEFAYTTLCGIDHLGDDEKTILRHIGFTLK